ncbi:MAG: transporter substrate-binding domain-containing protein [Xanthobacteraceae bacterium]|nr:transporter substrate-binding domain-containing protein [Xanthobacteraceae bacterium]
MATAWFGLGGRALWRRCHAVAVALFITGAGVPVALAQDTPFVPDEWKFGKRQDGAALNYCVDERDPDLPIAREIGRAVAQALLLQPKEHPIGQNTAGEDLDNLYRVFLESCDVFLGFKLISDAYPPWIAISRPYYRASYVLVTKDPGWKSLADMPKSTAIGATIGTSADIRLIQYLQSLPADQRWSRFPMGSDELTLQALARGTVGVALVWGPSFWGLQKADPSLAGLRLISPKPLPETTVGIGAILLANETFLRKSLDDAIAALTADGTIEAILTRAKFPATPAK